MRAWRLSTLSILCLALLAALCGAGPAQAKDAPQRCNGERRLCARTLDQVVLPTTHNAMSAASLGWQVPNQQVGIPDQLELGVRGFLIDTYYAVRRADGTVVNVPSPSPQKRELYLCHLSCALGATLLVDALRAVRDFLEDNPDEVLVFVNEDHVTARDFAKVVKRSGLGRYVYRGEPGPWPTLSEMIARRRQVVLLAESEVEGVAWHHPAYQGILQETPYSWPAILDITDPDPARLAASCRPNRGAREGSLFLLNHWSPPFGASEPAAALVNATGSLVRRAKACRAERGRVPNLLAVDLFRTGGLFAAVRKLNKAFSPG